MERYNPKSAEFTTKEIVMPAVLKEIKEGRGLPSGGVYVDICGLPWDLQIVKDCYSSVIETEGYSVMTRERSQLKQYPLLIPQSAESLSNWPHARGFARIVCRGCLRWRDLWNSQDKRVHHDGLDSVREKGWYLRSRGSEKYGSCA